MICFGVTSFHGPYFKKWPFALFVICHKGSMLSVHKSQYI